jgi:general stress protein 26
MDATLDEARRLLRQARFGFLATTGEGGPSVRLTEHLAVDDDLTVWVGTSPTSRKATQLAAHPTATYAVEDREGLGYVAVTGAATFDRDPERCTALWRPHLAAYFPGGPAGGGFALLRLAPTRAEVMSFGHGIHPDPLGLTAATLVRTPTGWSPAQPTSPA